MKDLPIILISFCIIFFAMACSDKISTFDREGYSGKYSQKHKQSLQISYLLTRECACAEQKRTDNFREDTLTQGQLLPFFTGSGFDRGHLKPADHSRCSLTEMKSSFSTLNISPQKPEFNRGVWKQLESHTKDYLTLSDSIMIVTGPILAKRPLRNKIGDITVPKYYYKAVKVNDSILVGFVLKHEKAEFNPASCAVSINELERLLKADLFAGTPEIFESTVDTVLVSQFTGWDCSN